MVKDYVFYGCFACLDFDRKLSRSICWVLFSKENSSHIKLRVKNIPFGSNNYT